MTEEETRQLQALIEKYTHGQVLIAIATVIDDKASAYLQGSESDDAGTLVAQIAKTRATDIRRLAYSMGG